jgi:hypothetical protein
MRIVKVLAGQTLVDIAIHYLGDAARALEVATLNELNTTDELTSGQQLIVPDTALDKQGTVAFFQNSAFAPASGITDEDSSVGEGIGWWEIENDFVVQ